MKKRSGRRPSRLNSYKRSSRDAYISRLSARQLVTTDRDGVTLSEELVG